MPLSAASDTWREPGQVMQGSVEFSNSMMGTRAHRDISKSQADKQIKDCPVFRGSSMKDLGKHPLTPGKEISAVSIWDAPTPEVSESRLDRVFEQPDLVKDVPAAVR